MKNGKKGVQYPPFPSMTRPVTLKRFHAAWNHPPLILF
jgi:hypothetical protein